MRSCVHCAETGPSTRSSLRSLISAASGASTRSRPRLTAFADASVKGAVGVVLSEAAADGKIKLADADDPGAGSGFVDPGARQARRARAELLERHRPRGLLRSRPRRRSPRASSRRPSTPASPSDLARLLQERTADGYVHRVDYGCGPTRARRRPRSRCLRLRLLRDRRPELGARRPHQGAADRRRPRARRALPRRPRAVHLAQIFRFRRDRRHPRDEASDPRRARPRRDRGRRPRHQARARRHPRDRVLRPDPAARLRRPAAAPARPAHPRHARRRCTTRAGSRRRRATSSPRPTASCARSSTGCRWSRTSRRSAFRPSPTALERFAQFCGFPTLDALREAL